MAVVGAVDPSAPAELVGRKRQIQEFRYGGSCDERVKARYHRTILWVLPYPPPRPLKRCLVEECLLCTSPRRQTSFRSRYPALAAGDGPSAGWCPRSTPPRLRKPDLGATVRRRHRASPPCLFCSDSLLCPRLGKTPLYSSGELGQILLCPRGDQTPRTRYCSTERRRNGSEMRGCATGAPGDTVAGAVGARLSGPRARRSGTLGSSPHSSVSLPRVANSEAAMEVVTAAAMKMSET
jgi:hypothetical protein